jgi:hypothetical protein
LNPAVDISDTPDILTSVAELAWKAERTRSGWMSWPANMDVLSVGFERVFETPPLEVHDGMLRGQPIPASLYENPPAEEEVQACINAWKTENKTVADGANHIPVFRRPNNNTTTGHGLENVIGDIDPGFQEVVNNMQDIQRGLLWNLKKSHTDGKIGENIWTVPMPRARLITSRDSS